MTVEIREMVNKIIEWGAHRATFTNKVFMDLKFNPSMEEVKEDSAGLVEFAHAIHAALEANKPVEVKHRSDWHKKRVKKETKMLSIDEIMVGEQSAIPVSHPGVATITEVYSEKEKPKPSAVPESIDNTSSEKTDTNPKRLELKKGEDGKLSEAKYGDMFGYGKTLKEATNSLLISCGDKWPEDMLEPDVKLADKTMGRK